VALRNIGPAARAAVPTLKTALRGDPDPEMRVNAALALGGILESGSGTKEPYPGWLDDVKSVAPELVKSIADPKENEGVRYESAVALSRMGDTPDTRAGMPALMNVVKDRTNPAKVRERTMWPIKTHPLQGYPELFDILAEVVKEPKGSDTRLLRYDAAIVLAFFKKADVPPGALDVLLEFLKDDTIKIYQDTTVRATGGTDEKGVGKAKAEESGVGDGRAQAVKALKRVGRERIQARQDIVGQLRALQADARTLPDLRKELADAMPVLDK
jgi:hypothetical protein